MLPTTLYNPALSLYDIAAYRQVCEPMQVLLIHLCLFVTKVMSIAQVCRDRDYIEMWRCLNCVKQVCRKIYTSTQDTNHYYVISNNELFYYIIMNLPNKYFDTNSPVVLI